MVSKNYPIRKLFFVLTLTVAGMVLHPNPAFAADCGSVSFTANNNNCDANPPDLGMALLGLFATAAFAGQTAVLLWAPQIPSLLSTLRGSGGLSDRTLIAMGKSIVDNRNYLFNYQQGIALEIGEVQQSLETTMSIMDYNVLRNARNVYLLDGGCRGAFISYKTHGIDGPLTLEAIRRYDEDFRNMINPPITPLVETNKFWAHAMEMSMAMQEDKTHSREFRVPIARRFLQLFGRMTAEQENPPNLVNKAAEFLYSNSNEIIEGEGWPDSLPHDADIAAIEHNIKTESWLVIPSDHAIPTDPNREGVRAYIARRISTHYGEYGFKEKPTQDQIQKLVQRIRPARTNSQQLNLLLTMYGRRDDFQIPISSVG